MKVTRSRSTAAAHDLVRSRSRVGSRGQSLFFNFLGETADQRITFTRASAATRFNSAGFMETMATNSPRFDYDPATVTERNIFIYSDFRSTFGLTKTAGVLFDAFTGLPGIETGIFFDTAPGVADYAVRFMTGMIRQGVGYVISCYVKMLDGLAPVLPGAGSSGLNDFSLVVGNTYSANPYVVESLGQGVYRVSAVFPPATAGMAASPSCGVYSNANQTGRKFRVTGVQVNEGAVLAPYYPTLAQPAGNGTPRGLLMEDARTNLIYPSMFAYTGLGTYYTVAAVNPLGGALTLANKFTGLGTGSPPANVSGALTSVVGQRCGWAIVEDDINSPAGTRCRLIFYQTAPTTGMWSGADFEPRTGAFSTSIGTALGTGTAGATLLMPVGPNGGKVWLFWIQTSTVDASNTLAFYPYPVAGAIAGQSVINHHAQVEFGAYPTSAIPTTNAQVTRAMDSFKIDRAGWYNPSASTLVADFGAGTVMSNVTSSTAPYYATIFVGKDRYQDGLFGMGGVGTSLPETARYGMHVYPVGGVGLMNRLLTPVGTALLGGKVAITATPTAQQGAARGVLDAAQAAAMGPALQVVDRLQANGQMNGWLKSLNYYPRAFSAAELQAATA